MASLTSKLRKLFGGRSAKSSKTKQLPPLPTDPFAERVDMDIAFRNDLHKVLYTRIRKGDARTTAYIWDAFLKAYPEFEHLREDWLLTRGKDVGPLNYGLPWMNYAAIAFLDDFLTEHARVFEWGMGGSTVFWQARAQDVISVEHDVGWFEAAQESLATAHQTSKMPNMILEEPDNEANADFASGAKQYQGKSFERYVRSIDQFAENTFDVIVVDGRARMACLRQAPSRLAPNGVIVLDNSDYTRYQPELEAFWDAHRADFERIDFLSPTPFSANIGSQTTVFTHRPKTHAS